MKPLVVIFLPICLTLFSCKSDSNPDATQEEAIELSNETESIEPIEEVNSDPSTFLFKSDDMGTREYLKLIEAENGERTWYYYSEKRPQEVKLGRKMVDGFENIFFTSSPTVLYAIGGSECGFHLADNQKETSQWYAQIEPDCHN